MKFVKAFVSIDMELKLGMFEFLANYSLNSNGQQESLLINTYVSSTCKFFSHLTRWFKYRQVLSSVNAILQYNICKTIYFILVIWNTISS